MPPKESKIKSGSLIFDPSGVPADFSCQPTNVRVTPSHETDGDALEVLCGDELAPDLKRTDTLALTSLQDFDDPAGLQRFSWDNDGEAVEFEWKPQGVTGPTFAGTVSVRAVEVGGDVNKRLTVDVEWPCIGLVTWTPAV